MNGIEEVNILSPNMLLVIGNGFDKAHGMKTSYIDILNFIWTMIDINYQHKLSPEKQFHAKFLDDLNRSLIFKRPSGSARNRLMSEWDNKYKNSASRKIYEDKIDQDIIRNTEVLLADIIDYTLAFGNIWLLYFTSVLENRSRNLGEGWIDFEEEIGRVVSAIESILIHRGENLDKYVDQYIYEFLNKWAPDIITLREKFLPILNFDFQVFSLWMEEALKVEDGKRTQKEHLDLIQKYEQNIKGVLSYNYTHTPDIYGLRDNVKFVHGELGKHNLVLGTAETLSREFENNIVDCILFKKKCQLMKYKLGNNFESVFAPANPYIWDAIIYGHSLTPADKYSLGWLFKEGSNELFAEHVKTIKIYYYDTASYNQQLKNLSLLITQDRAMNYITSGRICFECIQQADTIS